MSASLSTGHAYSAADAPESSQSAVSWAAVFAGVVVASATTIVLAVLGAGIGLTSISPWTNSGVSGTTFSIITAIGLIVVQWLSSGLGGFVTGRLRTKWVGVHNHEVFFRDTAHGLLTWAVVTLLGAVLLGSATSSLVGGGVRAVSSVAGGAAQGASSLASTAASSLSGYDLDTLFRSEKPDAANAQQTVEQAGRILSNGIANGDVPPADRAYLAQLVGNQTGISQADAQKRVDAAVEQTKTAATKAKQAADTARRSAAQVSIFTALSMLIGAFIAAVAAAYGGALRDD